MPPRTRRGAPARGGAAAAAASAETPKQETQPVTAILADTPPETAPASTAPAASTGRPSATPASSGSAAARSFALKPKVVRRADEERKALAEQEEKKFNDRAAEDARRRRASRGRGRGRGGRGRGRGDFAGGRDGLVRRTVVADGPFSQVPGAAPGRGGIRGPGGFGGGGGFGSGGGRGTGAGGNFSTVSGNAEYDSRLNTDTFNGRAAANYGDDGDFKDDFGAASSGGDGGGSGPSSSKSGGGGASSKKSQLLPMGIRREEHREPEVVVATTAELEAADAAAAAAASLSLEDSSDSDLFIDNSGGAAAGASTNLDDDDEVWSRAIKTHGSVKLVGADGEEIEVTDIDTLAKKRQELAEAAAARAAAAGGDSGSSTTIKREDGDEEMSLDSVSAQPSRAATVVAKKPKKAAPTVKKDPEDLAIEEGLQAMLHDLAMDPPQTSPDAQQPPTSLPGAEGSEEPQEQKPPPAREGRLFLFQFPPVLPSLKTFDPSKDGPNANGGSGSGAGGIKREPGTDDDVVMLDGVAPAPIDLTENDTDKRNTPSDIGSGGFLGTLSIRKSGRAELSWGGMTYEMMPGTDVQFLTTAVLLEESDEKRKPGEGGPALVGNAFGMGPVGGKYNLVPVFSEETEWTVDPSELVIEEEEEEEAEEVE
ncbi:hypothetical protein Sste5346_007228 [Sporothrix stenoceras]|uniref:Uncharacterized protein n=1 Tax=Sporothrix stenoceras TaxID=5173 RepID=A0ABR3YUK8_9PEZI